MDSVQNRTRGWNQPVRVLAVALGVAFAPASGQAQPTAGTEPARVTLTRTSRAAVPTLPSPLAVSAAQEFARQHHPDLQMSLADVEITRADSFAATIRPFNPELELSLSRGGESLTSREEGSVAVSVSQEFDPWRKGRSRRALAAARLRTAEAQLALRQQQLESQVRSRFQKALFLQNRVQLLASLAQQEQKIVAATQSRVREESVTPLTGRLTELDWVRIEKELLVAQGDSRQAVLALAAATGGIPPEGIQLVGTFEPDSLGVGEDSLVAMAVVNRRDSKALEERVADRQAELRFARVDGRPNVRLSAGISRERSGFRGSDFTGDPAVIGGIDALEAIDHHFEARVSVPLPLWQRNQGSQARAVAEVNQAQTALLRSSFDIEVEVRAAARAFDDALRLYRLYSRRAERTRSDLALVRGAYADGRISLDSYLTQKGRLVDTLLDQLEAEDRYWETRGRVEVATGADFATLVRGGSK